MELLIIILPLINSLLLLTFGKRLKRQGMLIITFVNVIGSSCLALMCLISFIWKTKENYIIYWFEKWFSIDLLVVKWSFIYDIITLSMCVVVTWISALVHIYSCEYMKEDPNIIKFLAYLSIFTFFMLVLVTAENFIQLFAGWEGVGISSYLLINFWYTRLQANKAAIKAILVNKIGDCGILIGIVGIYSVCKSVNFGVVFNIIPEIKEKTISIVGYEWNVITTICLFLFIGVIGKSAQIGLHTWLPDAMEGPTPVSALIHAATMVTAGVFVLIRCAPIFEYSETILILVMFVGALTSFFASTIGLFQYDIKKVIAYSTCSQLGYMVFACGMSNYTIGMLHLITHAFFKALLFLSAGSIIHALVNEQDMRRMGGLINILPYTYIMIMTGSLALIGFPFLSGYYSKDIIIETTYAVFTIKSYFIYWLSILAALCTASYSFRIINLVFIKKPNFYKGNLEKITEGSWKMIITLLILWGGSIFIGSYIQEWYIGYGNNIWKGSMPIENKGSTIIEIEYIDPWIKNIPLYMSILGLIIGLTIDKKIGEIYKKGIEEIIKNKKTKIIKIIKILKFFNSKWVIDTIYNKYIINKILKIGYKITFKIIDRGIIEIIGPLGIVRIISKISEIIRKITSGKIYNYILILLIGINILIMKMPMKNWKIDIEIIIIYIIIIILLFIWKKGNKKSFFNK